MGGAIVVLKKLGNDGETGTILKILGAKVGTFSQGCFFFKQTSSLVSNFAKGGSLRRIKSKIAG
jgi:hypothetical protein